MHAIKPNTPNMVVAVQWNEAASSCEQLLRRVEANDPTLIEIIILPNKQFGDTELDRLGNAIGNNGSNNNHNNINNNVPINTTLQSIQASGHAVTALALQRFGYNIGQSTSLRQVAIGDTSMSDCGVMALCQGLQQQQRSSGGTTKAKNCTTATVQENNNTATTTTTTIEGNSCALQKLDLSHKNISMYGLDILLSTTQQCCPHLMELNVSRNNLQILDWNDNDILKLGQQHQLPTIQARTMRKDNNNTIENDKDCLLLSNQQNNTNRIQYLDLYDCNIDTKTAMYLFHRMLPQYTWMNNNKYNNNNNSTTTTKLQLILHHNPIGDDGFQALLPYFSTLNGLYLSQCQLSDQSMHYWDQTTNSPTTTSQSHLDQHSLTNPFLRWNNATTTLDLSYNTLLTNKGVEILGRIIVQQQCQTSWSDCATTTFLVHTINLAGNTSIGSKGVIAFFDAVDSSIQCRTHTGTDSIQSPHLCQYLDLSETQCGTMGAIAAFTNSCNYGVMHLRLYKNQLGTSGFTSLAETIQQAIVQKQQRHYSKEDPITNAGSHSSSRRSSTKQLQTLDLSGNDANQDSVVMLLQSILDGLVAELPDIMSLSCLVIGGNSGGDNVEAMIQKIHQVQPTLDIARDKTTSR